MGAVTVSVSGTSAIISNIDTTNQQIRDKVDAAIQYAGIRCQALAKQYCPVGTPESTGVKGYAGGRLRSSIQYTPGILMCTVGTDVQYAIYVEMGTWKMRAQPFLNPAYQQALLELIDELNQI